MNNLNLEQTIAKCIHESSAKIINDNFRFDGTDLALVPEDFSIQSLDSFLPAPRRKKSAFNTSLIDSFSAYCKDELDQSDIIRAACFINDTALKAITVFDAGTMLRPQHCENTAAFILETTQEYDAIIGMNDRFYPQLDFTYWLEDYRSFVSTMLDSSGDDIDFKKGIHALRKITFTAQSENNYNEEQLSSEQSGFTKIEAKSGSEQNLPAIIEFKCQPSPDLDEINIRARVLIKNAKEGASIKLQIIQLEKLKQDLAISFQTLIQENLTSLGIPIYIGTYQKN